WSAGTLDTEVVKQGTSSLSGILRTAGLNTRTYTTTTFNSTGQHLRMWLNYASIGFLQTQANGGIRLFAQDTAGNIGYWYLGGIDTYDGGWTLLQVDMDRAFDAQTGTPNRTQINRVGFTLNLTGAPRNATNTWYDYLVRGNGLTITGGSELDPIDWAGVAAVDAASGYGAVRRQNGVYFVNTNLTIGGATTTVFNDTNQIVVFENQPVNADLYKLEPAGTASTTFRLTNSVIKSANTASRFDLLLNNANLNTLEFDGNTVVNADATRFKAGQSVSGCVFQGCNQIQTAGAGFTGNTVRGSTDALGALLWPDGTSVQNCDFVGNSRAIQINTTGTKDFIGITFSGNTFDINNTSGSAVTVNVSGGGTASGVTSTGSAVTVQASATLTLTGVVDGSEVRIYAHGTTTELYGLESKTAGVNPAYSYTSPQAVDIVVHNVAYNYFRLENYQLAASDATLPVAQVFDRNYRNP
ncbi:MAG: hypothetical protein KGZ68_18565, partial [Dechloromonas sp.]|nr:hypothetical protein [Dechloromonas sp.]